MQRRAGSITHGSKFNVLETTGQLDVFNYTINNNDKADLEWIDNGNDSEGIGIYAFIGDSKESIKYASCYTEEESAFVYILNVEASYVNNNKFAVIFDTSKIEIERIIDIKLEEKKQNINKLKI